MSVGTRCLDNDMKSNGGGAYYAQLTRGAEDIALNDGAVLTQWKQKRSKYPHHYGAYAVYIAPNNGNGRSVTISLSKTSDLFYKTWHLLSYPGLESSDGSIVSYVNGLTPEIRALSSAGSSRVRRSSPADASGRTAEASNGSLREA